MTAPENLLARVRALLAKAESTEFEAEAEAFNAKATELIARHGIDQALLAASGGTKDEIGQLRIDLDAPYTAEKQSLLTVIATAMRCRCIGMRYGRAVDHCVVIGYESDMQRVNLLYTSLLIQATGQLARQRPSESDFDARYYYRKESTVTYRKAWFAGFSTSVRDRLEEAERRAAAETVNSAPGMSTALVLRDRSALVDQHFADLYPKVKQYNTSVRSASGYSNGRSAGERADLGSARIGTRRRALSS